MMIGQLISHYKILAKLGEGGMGVVYKAQDTKLDRLVALKFLPTTLSSTGEDKARLVQEAKAAAALSHPNVCTIHGIEEVDDQMFIVMECVEGQSLRDKGLNIPLKQAIEIGIQLADGLAAAHEKGIVHRDLKPENIMIQKDGRVRIMDFGLAKLRQASEGSRLTQQGSTIGTVGYMSPEQVQGQETDHRTDIFSLGVILYELFAGQSPFKGIHETAIMYEIVNVDPEPMSTIKPELDPQLDAIVLECLSKELSERTQSVAEVAKDLRHAKRESSKGRTSRVSSVRPLSSTLERAEAGTRADRRELLPWTLAAVLAFAVIAAGAYYLLAPTSERQTIRSSILPDKSESFCFYGNFGGPAVISPNGTRLAYVAADSTGRRYIYVRDLRSTTAHRLTGTEGAMFPFWSPDNKFLGFATQGKLKKIDASGGPAISLCEVNNYRGGSWGLDGRIIFTPNAPAPLFTVSATGGAPTPLTTFDEQRKENSHRWPSFLSDGKHFLYFARTVATGTQGEGGSIRIASLDGEVNKILVFASSNAVLASGYLFYMRESNLVAQQFDEGSLGLRGEAVIVAEGVGYDQSVTRALFTASQNGILLYQIGNVQLGSRFVLYDQSGKALGSVGGLAEHLYMRLSPDGKRVATSIFDFQAHNNNIWIYDVARGLKNRLTFGAAYNLSPVWSPDGKKIIHNSNSGGVFNLYVKSSSGEGSEELVLSSEHNKVPLDWLPDGKSVLYLSDGGPKTRGDLFILSLSDRTSTPFLQTEFNELDARFSPDGKWIAHSSDESGHDEVYIKPYRGQGSRWQVSISGGSYPRWRRDGKELYYFSGDNYVMSADLTLRGSSVEVSNVHRLFEVPVISFPGDYDVMPDGKRFVVNTPFESQNQTPLTLAVNWDVELRKK